MTSYVPPTGALVSFSFLRFHSQQSKYTNNHPVCERCPVRGLVCHYALERQRWFGITPVMASNDARTTHGPWPMRVPRPTTLGTRDDHSVRRRYRRASILTGPLRALLLEIPEFRRSHQCLTRRSTNNQVPGRGRKRDIGRRWYSLQNYALYCRLVTTSEHLASTTTRRLCVSNPIPPTNLGSSRQFWFL